MSTMPATSKRMSLSEHLASHAKADDELRHLILQIAAASKDIQHAIRTTEMGLTGTVNQFGEEQQKLDVISNQIIAKHLHESKLVASYASEEEEMIIELDPNAPFSVAFDPLDGSSLLDVNFAIGSIFGIYKGKEMIGLTPRSQVAALYILYGPRTILMYASAHGVHEFMLNDLGEFTLIRENLGIADEGKTFSPGNIAAVNDNEGYKKALDYWLKEKPNLRYSGCMVADIHHVISKGQGVFLNVGGKKYPEGKLRLLFECGPFAYLAEQAGGSASTGTEDILDVKITNLDQRTPIIVGSTKEVKKITEIMNQH